MNILINGRYWKKDSDKKYLCFMWDYGYKRIKVGKCNGGGFYFMFPFFLLQYFG